MGHDVHSGFGFSVTRVHSSIPGPGKRSAWRETINTVYAPVDIDIHDADLFKGQIRISALPRIGIIELETDGETAAREKSHIGKDADEYFFLSIGRLGRSSFSQYGRDCVVDAGQFTLIYTAAPYVFHHRDRVRSITLRLPASALERRVRDPHALCAVVAPKSPKMFAAVTGLIQAAADASSTLSPTEAAVVEDSLLDLLGVGLRAAEPTCAPGGTSAHWAIHRRALSFMKDNLDEVYLTPDTIAAGIGISTRYLHRVFENTDQSVCECLIDLRIARCRNDLSDPGHLPMSIKEIAIRNGFKNQSHFASLFRSRFSVTPREFRRSAK